MGIFSVLFIICCCCGGPDTVKVTKVKGHASEDMVVDGRVRDLDLWGNNAADKAADFGRKRVPVRVIDARRNLVEVCSRWYPVVSHLHRFFVAIARAVVNHDDGGGTAPNPLVWSAGSLPKRRRVIDVVRNFAFLPGLVGIWSGVDNCASYSPYATHTLLPPFSQYISLRCSVRSNLCTSLLPVIYHVCLRGSSRTENARARTDTFTIVFSHGSGARLPRAPERGVQYNENQ